jgi:hypothetical protein
MPYQRPPHGSNRVRILAAAPRYFSSTAICILRRFFFCTAPFAPRQPETLARMAFNNTQSLPLFLSNVNSDYRGMRVDRNCVAIPVDSIEATAIPVESRINPLVRHVAGASIKQQGPAFLTAPNSLLQLLLLFDTAQLRTGTIAISNRSGVARPNGHDSTTPYRAGFLRAATDRSQSVNLSRYRDGMYRG